MMHYRVLFIVGSSDSSGYDLFTQVQKYVRM